MKCMTSVIKLSAKADQCLKNTFTPASSFSSIEGVKTFINQDIFTEKVKSYSDQKQTMNNESY